MKDTERRYEEPSILVKGSESRMKDKRLRERKRKKESNEREISII